mmetsp:Transcript_63146/g.137279  ORF Transcript_63146/g.137279 Transcript_63146/m.137279 type:complete len:108 (-) Transcript_63146:66-389(-)
MKLPWLASLGAAAGVLAVHGRVATGTSTLLHRGGASPDAERQAREAWLAAHLKDEFELDRNGRLAPQSGLNVAWNHKETRPRNAKNDCGQAPQKNRDQMPSAAADGS